MPCGKLVGSLTVVHRLDQLGVHQSALGNDTHNRHHLVEMGGEKLPWGHLVVPQFTGESNLQPLQACSFSAQADQCRFEFDDWPDTYNYLAQQRP